MPNKRKKKGRDSDSESFDGNDGSLGFSDTQLVKGPWQKQEDELLEQLVQQYGPKDWSTIATHMANRGRFRLGKQCRERWFNHLNPDVRKVAWTKEEDDIIIDSHKKWGNKWTAISKLLSGRPANAIKNHWNSTLKRRVAESSSSKNKKRKNMIPLDSSTVSTRTQRKKRNKSKEEQDFNDLDDFIDNYNLKGQTKKNQSVKEIKPSLTKLSEYHSSNNSEMSDINNVSSYGHTQFYPTKPLPNSSNGTQFFHNSIYQHDFLADDASSVHHQMMSSVNTCGHQQQMMFFYSQQPQNSTSIEVSNRTSYTWDPQDPYSELPTTTMGDFSDQYYHDYN